MPDTVPVVVDQDIYPDDKDMDWMELELHFDEVVEVIAANHVRVRLDTKMALRISAELMSQVVDVIDASGG